MSDRLRERLLRGALCSVILLTIESVSSAETGVMNAHLELGPGIALAGWQASELGTGLGVSGRLELALAERVGIELGGGYLRFFDGAHPPGYERIDGAYLASCSLGGRLRLLNDEQGYRWPWGVKPGHTGNLWGNLWLDAHGSYFYTGGVSRFGADAGVGVELSIVDGLQLGPFARVVYVYQPDSENPRDSADAWIIAAGIGGSLAIPPRGRVLPDSDGDGFFDPADGCPTAAEDVDRFEDLDGCPDDDNDGDGILDPDDECPDRPEDVDGFEDLDGCPDDDNDGDRIPDADDGCRDRPEDVDGFEDLDGCPDDDNDGDRVPDADDRCPGEPENINGFSDDDGCPEPDADADGIPDGSDRCPQAAETINGLDDEDGCPDEALVEVRDDRILGGDRIFFGKGRVRFKARSRPTMRQLAQLLDAHPEFTLISIEGHADHSGPRLVNRELSRLRAEQVRQSLIRRGIAPERLQVAAFGESQPWQRGRREEIRALNRRVELRILEIDVDLARTPIPPEICAAVGLGRDCVGTAGAAGPTAGTEDAKTP